MTESEKLISQIDAAVDSYHGGGQSVGQLMELRKDLAVNLYRLAAHVKQAYGNAGLTYLVRKHKIAESIVNGRNEDVKAPFNLLEQKASSLATVLEAQKAEVWAEAEKEALKMKIDLAKQVLASMQQELAFLTYEYKNTHQQA